MTKLFSRFQQANLDLPNRIVMAPMTRTFSPNGVPTEDVAGYYRRRAEGGVGLIITEGTTVNHDVASLDRNVPHFHGEQALAGWQHVVNEVHAAGGKIVPQLWHAGMMRDPRKQPNADAPSAGPSGLLKPGKQISEPMTEQAIEHVINVFGDAALAAQKLGFDGVEIHGAHGYLIDQFFWAATNQRTDQWGGDLIARTRFGEEIIKDIRRKVGPDFPLILRFSQWKQQDYTDKLTHSPQELEQFLQPLTDAGVDIFHCSTRRFWETEFAGSELNLAGWTKQITGKPTITVGSVGLDGDFMGAFAGQGSETAKLDKLLERLERQEFDLVGVGRALLVDPEWPNKVREQRHDELQPFTKEALMSLS